MSRQLIPISVASYILHPGTFTDRRIARRVARKLGGRFSVRRVGEWTLYMFSGEALRVLVNEWNQRRVANGLPAREVNA